MSGPLTGYRVIEIAGIGPGPFAAMMLADMGAEVIRVERAGAVRGPAPDDAAPRPPPARTSQRRDRPQAPGRRRHAARPGRAGRRADRGVPARGDGATRCRPRRVPRPQPEARVRADDRVGPGRAVRHGRRPRHQLHRARRCARPLRASRRAADPADEHGRRLRRRRHVPRVRCRLRAARGAAQRRTDRSSTRRWSTVRRR